MGEMQRLSKVAPFHVPFLSFIIAAIPMEIIDCIERKDQKRNQLKKG